MVGFWALRCLFVVLGFRGWSLGLGWIVGFPVGWVRCVGIMRLSGRVL